MAYPGMGVPSSGHRVRAGLLRALPRPHLDRCFGLDQLLTALAPVLVIGKARGLARKRSSVGAMPRRAVLTGGQGLGCDLIRIGIVRRLDKLAQITDQRTIRHQSRCLEHSRQHAWG